VPADAGEVGGVFGDERPAMLSDRAREQYIVMQ
jgi:hypothetical protein